MRSPRPGRCVWWSSTILTVTGLTPFTGALALAIGGIGTHGKWTYQTIEAVPGGTAEAVSAAGGNVLEVARWGPWTAAAPELMSLALYRLEINVHTSAILGLIGVGGARAEPGRVAWNAVSSAVRGASSR